MKVANFLIILSLFVFLSGCSAFEGTNSTGISFINYNQPRDSFNFTADPQDVSSVVVVNESATAIKMTSQDVFLVGAFNVQIFGKTKAQNVPVMEKIEDIIRDYDIIAIQEIRDSSGLVIEKLEAIYGYDVVCSERLGRTSSKEQYCVLYRPSVVSIGKIETYPDVGDKFEREPFMVNFGINNFTFTMVVVHIKPTDAVNEIFELDSVVKYAVSSFSDEDVIVIGDLNHDCAYTDGVMMTQYTWLIDQFADTTVGSTDCAYDRIMMNVPSPYVHNASVVEIVDYTNGDKVFAKAISDHNIVDFEVITR